MPPSAVIVPRHPSTSPIILPNNVSMRSANARRAQARAASSEMDELDPESFTVRQTLVRPSSRGRIQPRYASRSRDRAQSSSLSPAPATGRLSRGRRRAARSQSRTYLTDEAEDPPEPADAPPPLPSSATRINRLAHTSRRPKLQLSPSAVRPPSPTGSASSALSSAGGTPPSSRAQRPAVAPQSSDSSIRALDDDEVDAIDPDAVGRRYTAAEKGKGRAVVQETIVVDSPGGRGKKRKADAGLEGRGEAKRLAGGRTRVEGIGKGFEDGDEIDGDGREVEAIAEEESEDEDGEFLDEFCCPVCFSSPTRPVATLCGHVLCSDCLHSSLLSAIGRNPNPLPAHLHAQHHAGPAPRAPSRGPRVNHTRAKAKSDPVHNPSPDSADAQPLEWTLATLQAKVVLERKREKEELEKAAEVQFEAADMPKESWEAAKIGLGLIEEGAEGDGDGKGLVVEVLKGLWRIPTGTVVEGECPVCRNGIPGGMGPFGSGIGSILPLYSELKM